MQFLHKFFRKVFFFNIHMHFTNTDERWKTKKYEENLYKRQFTSVFFMKILQGIIETNILEEKRRMEWFECLGSGVCESSSSLYRKFSYIHIKAEITI